MSRPHSWFQLAALPAIAGLCLLLALFAEGRGLLPLQEGLRQAREYPPAGSLALNLYTQIRADEIAAAALLVATGLLVRLVILNYQRAMPDSHQVRLAGFCVCAAVATLAQFARRPYLHYALLPAPCLIIAVVILAQQGCRQLVPRRLRGEVLRWGLMLLAALPWLYAIRRPDTLAVWRVVLPREFVVQTLWHQQPEISRSLNALRSVVAPGESLAVVPPRLNSVHYLLGSRCEPGQGYGFGITRAQLDWERLPRVLVVKNSLDEADHALWGGEERERLARRLIAAGFVVELDLDSMTLYRRRSTR